MTTDEEIASHLAKLNEVFGELGPNGDVTISLVTLPGWCAYFSKYDGRQTVDLRCTKVVRAEPREGAVNS